MALTKSETPLAWIIGASSGIGRALALRLARDGWTVAASARNAAALETLAGEAPGRIHAVPVDITDREAVKRAWADIGTTLGDVSLCVLGAGTYVHDSALNFDGEAFKGMVDLNVIGTAYCLEAIMPVMIARHSGHIAVMASVAGFSGLPGAIGYGATKAALINMCEAIYPELEAQGVRLSVINPGFVDTPLTRKNDFPMPFLISAEEAADHIVKGLASQRFEIVFPWKMALSTKFLQALPAKLRFFITRRMLKADGSN